MFALLTFMLTVGLLSHGTEGVNSTCESLSVSEGEETNITCYFDEDVSKLQRDIKLYHNTYTVLTISWKEGRSEIHSKPGYQFQGGITSKLTVSIPRAQMENGGTYSCHVVLSKASAAKPCTLKVFDRCAVNLNTSSSNYNSTGCTQNITEVKCSNVALMAGLFIVCALLVISACFNAYFIVRIAKRTRHENQSDNSHLEQEDLLNNGTTKNTSNHPEPGMSQSLLDQNRTGDDEEQESEVEDLSETTDVTIRNRSDSAYNSARTSFASNNK